MRTLLVYIFFGVALWYLVRAAMRHYLSRPKIDAEARRGNPDRGIDRPHGNYDNARDARYRDVE